VIDRVNQKPFLIWQAEAVVRVEAGEPETELPDDVEDLPSPEEIAETKAALSLAIVEEKARPLTTPAPLPDEDRDGETPEPPELFAYMPRSAPLSLLQSALDRYLMEYGLDLLTDLRQDPELRADEVSVANFELHIETGEIPPLEDEDRRLGEAFGQTDLRWVSAMMAMGWGKLRRVQGRRLTPAEPAPPHALDPRARVVVVGDWASGLGRARRVADQMRRAIYAALEEGRECHAIHLGDTYYGGWRHEYSERFLPNWPVRPGDADRVGSWSLAGNHDMYTGGEGYYEVLLTDPRFRPYQQGSSRFSLENEHWQLLGVDTSWKNHALAGDQVGWIEDKLDQGHPTRRTMLLSHHQPLSAYNDRGGGLSRELAGPLSRGEIDAWLWGHEHRCAVYEPVAGLPFPCCIGHGGVPVGPPGRRPPGVEWHLDRALGRMGGALAFSGCAILDFDGPQFEISFVAEDGQVDFQKLIR